MRYLPLAALLAGVCALHAIDAPSPVTSYKGPVHAELLKRISVRDLQPGSSVFVRVTSDWSGLNCTLHKGAIVEAKVEAATRRVKHKNGSELALSFSKAQCSGVEMAPMDLFLAAISYVPPDPNADSYPGVRYMFSPGISTMGPGAVPGGNLPAVAASSSETLFTKRKEFRAMNNARQSFKPGEVNGIKDLSMKLDGGPHHSSLLTDKKRDIVLEKDTEFVLVPTSLVLPKAESASGSSSAATVAKAEIPQLLSAPPPIQFAPCEPPSCNTDLRTSTEHATGHPSESISIRALGYAPRPQEFVTRLNNDQALAWLAPNRVLVAFNPHKLVYRNAMTTADAPVRTIRAVLLDTAGKQVVSTADWQLSDSGKYLWKMSEDRILVHVRNEVRVYDSQLQMLQRLPLSGALEFLRISPNGQIIAVGVVKERHTPELHDKLRRNLGREPEEDVEVTILDKDFKTIAQASTNSSVLPPALLNEGQLNLLAESNHRYRLSLLTWNEGEKTLARFSSACVPQISTFAPDLTFVRTCEMTVGAPEIHVLRANGQEVMRSQPDVDEFGHEAKGNGSSQTFALKVLHTAAALSPGVTFQGSDLTDVELRIYRAADGKRLATFRTNAPAPSYDGYGLSPDGSQVAVLAAGQVDIFSVPAP